MKSVDLVAPAQSIAERDLHRFMPATFEVFENPPSPAGRGVAVLIIFLFCFALVWATFGKIDVVAIARGRVISSGKTKFVQPFDTGVVRSILVKDGDTVREGQPLLELDSTNSGADVDRLRNDQTAALLDIARLKSAIARSWGMTLALAPPPGATAAQISAQLALLERQMDEYSAKLTSFDRQRAQKEAETATIDATVAKLEKIIPVMEERLKIRKAMFDQQLGSKVIYLETLQLLIEQQQELAVHAARRQENLASIATIDQQRSQAIAEFRRIQQDDLVKAEQKVNQISQDLIKAEHKNQLQILNSPVAGTVQQLAVNTVGAVVTSAQVLAAIVPFDDNLQIEAAVQNRDIGFVRSGQDVEIKIESFPFTRYGLLHGKVTTLSRDAAMRQKPDDQRSSEKQAAETVEQDLTYLTRISLEQKQIDVEGTQVSLMPGMAVTAEIKTGSRTVLQYLLSPVKRYRQDALRER